MNQIRSWVRQGRTDAWVAHQLEVSVRDIEQFKRQNELVSDEEPTEGGTGADYPGEIDLRAEDDALIAAELEAAEMAAEIEAARVKAEAPEAPEDEESDEDLSGASPADGDTDGEGAQDAPRRRRGRRGGRGRRPIGDRPTPRGSVGPLEGTFEHGEEGYGLWLDPAVQDNPIYAEHWAGHRSVEVLVEEDQIVIRRTGADD